MAKTPLKPDQKILDAILAENRERFPGALEDFEYFEIFGAEQIMKDGGLDFDDLKNGISSGGNDGGIDGIYFSLDSKNLSEDEDFHSTSKSPRFEINIIQAKTTKSFAEQALERFIGSFPKLFDIGAGISKDKELFNSDILAKSKIFHDVFEKHLTKNISLSFKFWYVTKGTEVHKNTKKRVPELQKVVSSLYDDAEFEFNFVGASELKDLFHKVPSRIRLLQFSKLLTTDGSYVCLSRLSEFYKFISSSDEIVRDIFESNVRDHQGNTTVNKGIRETLGKKDSPNFWHLNNGVTVLTSEATQAGSAIRVNDPQIVNGLQTSTEIFNHFNGMTLELMEEEDREVLVRVIDANDDITRDSIIRATNSQNSLPSASLRSSDKIHRDIEDYFVAKNWYYDRKKNKWKNERKPAQKIVSIVYLAQVMMSAVLQRPNDARARPSNLINSDAEYESIFEADFDPEVYLNCAILGKKIEKILKLKIKDSEARRTINNIRFYVLFDFVRTNRGTAKAEVFLRDMDTEKIKDSEIMKSIKKVRAAYKKTGGDDAASKGKKMLSALGKNN